MSRGDDVKFCVNGGGQTQGTGMEEVAPCIIGASTEDTGSENNEPKTNGLESDAKCTEIDQDFTQVQPLSKTPVRALINLYENPKPKDSEIKKVTEIHKPSVDYLDLVQKHDKFINEQQSLKPETPSVITSGVTKVKQAPENSSQCEQVTELEQYDPGSSVPSGDSEALDDADSRHTVKATHNLFKVDTKPELDQILRSSGSRLVFLFFFPDNCDMDEPFKKSFLPKVQELSFQHPLSIFITIYIDVENQGWLQWSSLVSSFKTCSIVGPTFVLFQDGERIHEGEAYGSKALGNMVTELIHNYQTGNEAANADLQALQNDVLHPGMTKAVEHVAQRNSSLVPQDFAHVLPEFGAVDLGFSDDDVPLEPRYSTVQPQNSTSSESSGNPQGHLSNNNKVTKSRTKSRLRTIMQGISDFIPNAVQKAVGEVKGVVDEIVKEFADASQHDKRQLNSFQQTQNSSMPSHEASAKSSNEAYVQIVRSYKELKETVTEVGSKVVIAFVSLDSSLTKQVLQGNFFQKLEQVAHQNPHLLFLTLVEEHSGACEDTEEHVKWRVPLFLVFKMGKELERVSLEIETWEDCLGELESALRALVLRYRMVAGTAIESTIMIPEWKDLIYGIPCMGKLPPSPYVIPVSKDELEKYLQAAGSTLVIVCFYIWPGKNMTFETKVLPVLETLAVENPDVSFLSSNVHGLAWRVTSSKVYWPGLFFFKNTELIHEESITSIWILVNKLPNLINKFK